MYYPTNLCFNEYVLINIYNAADEKHKHWLLASDCIGIHNISGHSQCNA